MRHPQQRIHSRYSNTNTADTLPLIKVRALHAAVLSTLGPPNILFLNAGTSGGLSNVTSLADVPIDVFERTWRINCGMYPPFTPRSPTPSTMSINPQPSPSPNAQIGSPILLTQLSLPSLPTLHPPFGGRIILNSSVAAFTGGSVGPHYASSKSAQHGFVHWLAARCAASGSGVTVNAVAPALVSGTAILPTGGKGEAELAKRVPVGRLGRPAEVAETVVWMVKTGYVTSKVVAVDGGLFVQ